jgi:hypothetical protein
MLFAVVVNLLDFWPPHIVMFGRIVLIVCFDYIVSVMGAVGFQVVFLHFNRAAIGLLVSAHSRVENDVDIRFFIHNISRFLFVIQPFGRGKS